MEESIKFGTGVFRGVIGDTFTKPNIQKICQAMANLAEKEGLKKQVCIGFDNRFMSEDFAGYCAEVFLANGFVVNLFKKPTSTPVVMYQTMVEENDYGVMITASHNPYKYNGIKIFVKNGKDASVEETQKIEKEFKTLGEVKATNISEYEGKNLNIVDHFGDFISYLVKNQEIPEASDLKVAFDNKYGSTTEGLRLLCKKIKLNNYKILHANRNAFFGFKVPLPSKENVSELKDEVIKNGYDVGFALDSDGDRLGVVDENGRYIDNNKILALIYYYFVKYEHKTGGVVKNLATSYLVDALANKFGFNCYEVPVGFKYVSSKLIETKSIVGGESSGGLAVSNHIWGKDSLLSIALCIKIMKKLNKPFGKCVDEMLAFVDNYSKVVDEEQFVFSHDEAKRIKEEIYEKKEIPKLNLKVEKTNYDDGLKVYYPDGNWTLVRFSGTEPLLRIFIEMDNINDCKKELDLWKKFLGI
ncbi:MAG: hypothetical protein J5689_00570 [Clostridia bacterium]|nr:hypothetical protein [Clostridia bacterium]